MRTLLLLILTISAVANARIPVFYGKLYTAVTPLAAGVDARIALTPVPRQPWKYVGAATIRAFSPAGVPQQCNTTSLVPWERFELLGRSNLTATFTTPGFPFRFCAVFNNRTAGNRLLFAVKGLDRVYYPKPPLVYFAPPIDAVAGDFATLRLLRSSLYKTSFTIPSSNGFDGDLVKLVPAGIPCSLEANYSKQFCGAKATVPSLCVSLGAAFHGVARVGTRKTHPAFNTAPKFTKATEALAYVQLPSQGIYEVCYSSRLLRANLTSWNPMWIKAMNAGSCFVNGTVANCKGMTSKFSIASVSVTPATFSLRDLTGGSWTALTVTGTNLSAAPAVGWDCNGCDATRDYWSPARGDALRLISTASLTETATGLPSSSSALHTSVSTVGFQSDTFFASRQSVFYGTGAPIGCWDYSNDAYGVDGATSSAAVNTANGDTGNAGRTATGNLGADERTGTAAMISDATRLTKVAAFLRLPLTGSYAVCYRSAMSSSWRILSTPSGSQIVRPTPPRQSSYRNMTFAINDTRAGTTASAILSVNAALLPLTASNFFDTTVADSAVRSIALRVVPSTQPCTASVSTQYESWNAGQPECHPSACGFSTSCGLGKCYGRKDDSAGLFKSVAMYFNVPPAGQSYRVCVRLNTLNWFSLATLTPQPAPVIRFIAGSPIDAGSWLKLSFAMTTAYTKYSTFDVRSSTSSQRGDMVRIVPQFTNGVENFCDLTWLPGDPQLWNSASSLNLGVDCTTANGAPCTVVVIGKTLGTYPYAYLDSTYDGRLTQPTVLSALAFLGVPSAAGSNTAFKVCYKQAGLNWLEVSSGSVSTVSTRTAMQACNLTGDLSIPSGQRGSIQLNCTLALNPLLLTAKLTSTTCDRAAAGNTGYQNDFATLAGANASAGFAFFTNATSGVATTTSNVLWYNFAAPVVSTTTVFSLCVNEASSAAANWIPVGTVTVVAAVLTYTLPAVTYHRQVVTLTFTASAAILNTLPGGDQAKIVSASSPCTDVADSASVSAKYASSDISTGTWNGVTDLGPGDLQPTTTATMTTTIPNSTSTLACFKVCYRRSGQKWIEVGPSAVSSSNSIYNGICSVAPVLDRIEIDAALFSKGPVVGLMSGASTVWPYWLVNQLTLDPTPVGSVDLRYVRIPSSAGVTRGQLKFVEWAVFIDPNLFTRAAASCASAPALGTQIATFDGLGFAFDLPATPGQYLICYAASSTDPWVQVTLQFTNGTAISTPVLIVDSGLGFNVSADKSVITVTDSGAINVTGAPLTSTGTLAITDPVYIINATGVCGLTPGFLRGAVRNDIFTALARLTTVTTSGTQHSIPTNASGDFVPTAVGQYKLCYFRTVDAGSYLRRNQWYHAPLVTGKSVSTPFYDLAPPVALAITCPPYTSSSAAPNGVSLNVAATLQAVTGAVVSALGRPYVLQGNNLTLTVSGDSCTTTSAPNYGLTPAAAPQVSTVSSTLNVVVNPITACSGVYCGLSLTSGAASATCVFAVSTATVTSLLVQGPTTCLFLPGGDTSCGFSVSGFDTSGALASTATSAVSMTVVASGTGFTFSTLTASVTLSGGVATFTTYPVLTASQGSGSAIVTFTSGSVTTSVTVTVPSPVVGGFNLVSIIRVNASNAPVMSSDVPDWFPTTTAGAVATPATSWSSIIAGAYDTHYLVAREFYQVTVIPVALNGLTITDANYFPSLTAPIVLNNLGTGRAVANNSVLALPPAGTDAFNYATTLSSVTLAPGNFTFTFRLKSSAECGVNNGGCSLAIGGGSLPVATINTTVRSSAKSLTASCRPSGTSFAFSATGCQSSVETGMDLRVTAVDQFGTVDDYFQGRLSIVLTSTTFTKVLLSTVATLGAGAVSTNISANISNGMVVLSGVTTSNPCPSGCSIMVVADWNVAPVSIPFTITPSTTRLQCALTTSLYWPNGTVIPTLNASTISQALIYTDTELCFNVSAASATGAPTMYETVWAYYTIRSSRGLSARATQLLPRVAPLTQSQVRFCFVVSGITSGSATFNVEFGVQNFGTDSAGRPSWTLGSSGRCSLGAFTLQYAKIPAGLAITGISGGSFTEMAVSPYQSPTTTSWVWAQHALPLSDIPTRSLRLNVQFGLIDFYGRALVDNLPSGSVVIDGCAPANVRSGACASGSGPNAFGGSTVNVVTDYDPRDVGMLTASVTSASSAITTGNGTIAYNLGISRVCVNCRLTFTVWASDSAVYNASSGNKLQASLTVSLVLPTTGPAKTVAFTASTTPFGTGAWQTSSTSSVASGTQLPSLNNNVIAVLQEVGCLASTSCRAADADLIESACAAPSTMPIAADATGTPTRLAVFMTYRTADAFLTLGAPSCGGSRSVSSCYSGSATAVTGHVDIFELFALSISVGSQLLRCPLSAPCAGNNSVVATYSVPALGASVAAALLATAVVAPFGVPVLLSGVQSSDSYLLTNSRPNTVPNVAAVLSVTANASAAQALTTSQSYVTGSTGQFQLVWRGAPLGARLRVRDFATEAVCGSEPLRNFTTSGYLAQTTLSAQRIAFAAQFWEPNVSIPITVDVVGNRGTSLALSASGTVTPVLQSSVGCGNGGRLTVVSGGTLVGGRANLVVSFSQPCEGCVLRFVVTPSGNAAAFADMLKVPFALEVQSPPIKIYSTGKASALTVASLDDPAKQYPVVSIGQTINITAGLLVVVGAVTHSNVAPTATGTVRIFNKIMRTSNLVLVGNGGVVRSSATQGIVTPMMSLSGTTIGRVGVYFARPCQSCGLTAVWSTSSGTSGQYDILTSSGTPIFTVTAPAVRFARAGDPQTMARVGSALVIAVRPAAADGAGYVPQGNLTFDPTITKTVVVATNGDASGYTVRWLNAVNSWVALINQLTPCAKCTFAVSGVSVTSIVVTSATSVRLLSLSSSGVPVTSSFTASILLSDDSGYADMTIGGPSDCTLVAEFVCVPSSTSVQMIASADGQTVGGFSPTSTSITVGGADTAYRATLSNALVVDGSATAVTIKVSTPIRGLTPIFTVQDVGLSTLNASRYRPSIDVYDPSWSSGNLVVGVESAKYTSDTLSTLTVKFGVGDLFGNLGLNYAASQLNSTISIALNSACSTSQKVTSASIVKGIGSVALNFVAATPSSQPCVVTFTMPSSIGCTTCSATTEIVVTDPAATGYSWLRPTTLDNNGLAPGPTFAAAGRGQRLRVVAVASVNTVNNVMRRCSNCGFSVETVNCAQSPVINVTDFSQTNATFDAVVRWPVAAAGYSCTLRSKFYVAGNVVQQEDRMVTVCVPAKLLATNFSTSTALLTGVSYTWYVRIVDSTGAVCVGDSQDDASTVSLSLAAIDGSASNIQIINTNTQQTTTAALASSYTPPLYANSVKAVAGTFAFSFVLTAASSVRMVLRAEAQSTSPTFDSIARSAPFFVKVAASRMRLRPDTAPAQYIVSNRMIAPGSTKAMVVQAVDAIPDSWSSFIAGVPNVDQTWSGQFQWTVDPLPSPFPLTFVAVGASRVSSFVRGVQSVVWNFTGPDGLYTIGLRDPQGSLATSATTTVVVQSIASFAIQTTSGWCTNNCAMPNSLSQANSAAALVIQGVAITIKVALLDSKGNVVQGDYESTLGIRMIKASTAGSNADMKDSTGTVSGPFKTIVTNGQASFTVVFTGTTVNPTTFKQETVQLQVFCPLLQGQWNPCQDLGLPVINSVTFNVASSAPSTDITTLLNTWRPTIQVPSTLSSLSSFSVSNFQTYILTALLGAGSGVWPPSASALSNIVVTVCEVDRGAFGYGTLGSKVCGTSSICTTAYDVFCPTGVRQCTCPSTSSSRRRLEQLPVVTTQTLELQIEVSFSLKVTDVVYYSDIPTFYNTATQTVINAMRTSSQFTSFNLLTSAIRVVQYNAPSTAPTTTTSSPTATTTTVPVATTPAPTTISAAWSPTVVMLLGVSVLVALIA